MDSFMYLSLISRIEHYEQIARRMARESRRAPKSVRPSAPVTQFVKPVEVKPEGSRQETCIA